MGSMYAPLHVCGGRYLHHVLILVTTMRCWKDDWAYHGQEIPRQWVQHAYREAPADMKVALGEYGLEQSRVFMLI